MTYKSKFGFGCMRLPQTDENMLKTSIEKLLEIVFNPLAENNKFNEEYVKI